MVCDTRIGASPTEGSSTSSSLGADMRARTAPYPASTSLISRLSPKVSPLHFRVLHDLRRRAFADDPAGVEADDALREAHHRLHDVLDHDDGDAGFVQLGKDLQHLVDF